MKYILRTNKLLIDSKNFPNSAFIYTGSPNKEQKDKGKLIIILEFPEETEKAKELGNLLIQKIDKLYYDSTLIDQESILENILEEVNENLPLLTKINDSWLKKFNAIIGIIYRQETYFSPVGDVSAWVVSSDELINIFDYLENNDIEKPSIDRIFTNILSGTIEPNQTLIFTTNAMFDYIKKDSIEKIALNNDPSGINIKLKEHLFKVKNRNFCLVSVKLSPLSKINVEEKSVEIPIEMMPDLNPKNIKVDIDEDANKLEKNDNDNQIEEEGELIIDKEKEIIQEQIPIIETVAPKESYNYSSSKESLDNLLNIQQKTKDILQKGKSELSKEETIPKENTLKTSQLLKAKKTNTIFKDFLSITSKIISYPFIFINQLIKTLFKKKKTFTQMPISGIEGQLKSKKGNRNKTILIIAAILLIAFVSSIFITKYLKTQKQEKEKYTELLNTITEKKTEYDMISIYKDEKLAKEKLKEISDLINELPQKTNEQKQKYQEILDSFTEMLNKIWNIDSIKNPNIIAEINFYPEKIFKHNNYIIALGQNSNEITKIDINSKQSEQFGIEGAYAGLKTYAKNKNFIYGIDTDNKLAKIDIDAKSISKVEITYHPNFKSSKDMAFYNDRIYILDTENNQIYKHSPSGNNFSKGEAWITDNSDIKNALSITIDSTIYLGNSGGTITTLYTGKLKPFTLQEINPTINNINKIYTDNTIKEIYLLDSQTKRIVVINKSGELIKQHYFPTLNKLDDFVFDGASKTIYIQSENKIIEVK